MWAGRSRKGQFRCACHSHVTFVACQGVREALSKCRWLMRRLQGFASIKCDTVQDRPIDASALMTLMAKLSGAFTKGTELHIVSSLGAGP